jgi:membrane-associated phospholipid phosphatase
MGGIEFVQGFASPFLDIFFQGVTIIAEKFIMMFVVGYFYWCTSKDFGERFILTVMSGFSVNAFFKNLFRVERPFVKYKDEIRALRLSTATGYSYPSGHTQTATTVFGLVGFRLKRFFPIISAVLIFLIGLSRVYLGVHTVYDVLGGLAFGLVWSYVGFWLYKLLTKKENPLWLLVYIIPAIFAILAVNPLFVGDTFSMTGTSVGAIVGVVIENFYIGFQPVNSRKNQFIKIFVGFSGALILEAVLKAILGSLIKQDTMIGCAAVFASYFLCGFWITAGLPFISKKFLEKDLVVNNDGE